MTERKSLLGLAACGAGTAVIYLVAFTHPYPIEVGLARPLLHFGRITGPSGSATLAYVLAVAALFGLYLAAIRLCLRLEGRGAALAVVLGFGCLSALILVPMYPVFSLDIFYYMAADRIWSLYRENPFVVPPLQAAHDPFFPYTTWGHYPLPYGPLWPWITAAASVFGHGSVPETLLAFKGLSALAYGTCLPIILWSIAAVTPQRRLAGLAIFAWNPLVLLELVGNGHNDSVALVPAALALGLWARRASVAAALGLALSFLIKATVAVAIPGLLWASFCRARANHQVIPWLLTHALPALALFALAWLPFWNGATNLSFMREADQHYQSVTAILMAAVPQGWKAPALRTLQLLLLGGFAAYYVSQLRSMAAESRPALHAAWRLTIVYFALVSPFYMGWYMVWPTLIAALTVERRMTALTVLLCIGSLATHVVQFVLAPLGRPSLGSAQINSLAIIAAFGPFLLGWWALGGHESPLSLWERVRVRAATSLR